MNVITSVLALALALTAVSAQANLKPNEAIKYRQSGYAFMAWNMGRIRSNVEGEFKRDEVVKAATAIQAIANSGMGALYLPGTDKGKGWEITRAKPEIFSDGEGVAKVAIEFNQAANALAAVSAEGSPAEVKAAFGKLSGTCKACHDKYRGPEKH